MFRKYLKIITHKKNTTPVNLFIVGEQKCGTSSLHNLLINSPLIIGGQKKELHFFDSDKFSTKEYPKYEQQFNDPRYRKTKYLLDSSPSYAWDSHALQRIKSYNPEAKLIYLIRDLISRFFSSYSFYRTNINSNHPGLKYNKNGARIMEFLIKEPDFTLERYFEIEISDSPIFYALERGNYHIMINQIKSLFLEDQVLYSTLEYITNPDSFDKEMMNISSFLSIKLKWPPQLPKLNMSENYKLERPKSMVSYLKKYYKLI